MSRSISPRPQGSVSAVEMALSLGSYNSGSRDGTGGEYSTLFHFYTSIIPPPVPTARSKRKADDLGCADDNNHQAKRQRPLAPVAMVDGNIPLKKTWEMMELSNRKGLLTKF